MFFVDVETFKTRKAAAQGMYYKVPENKKELGLFSYRKPNSAMDNRVVIC